MREPSEERVLTDAASCNSGLTIPWKARDSLSNFRALKTLKESVSNDNLIRRAVTFNNSTKSQKIN